MTEKELRQKVVDTAVSYLGCKEANGSHRKIIDLYNSHKPLARGYAVPMYPALVTTFSMTGRTAATTPPRTTPALRTMLVLWCPAMARPLRSLRAT